MEEEQLIPGASWEALKERFRRNIIPHLAFFNMSAEEEVQLKLGRSTSASLASPHSMGITPLPRSSVAIPPTSIQGVTPLLSRGAGRSVPPSNQPTSIKPLPSSRTVPTRPSNSSNLSEAVRNRNQCILAFTDKLVQRAKELGESDKRIEEIRQIQLKKLILPPEAELQSQPGRLASPSTTSSRSKHPPQSHPPQTHQYSLRESSSLPSYRESSNHNVSPSGQKGSSAQSLAPSPCSPFFTAPSFSSSGGDESSLGPSPASSPSQVDYSKRDSRFKCSICPIWFRDSFNLEKHNRVHNAHHDHAAIICLRAWCTEEFLTKFERKTHMDDCVWSCPEPLCDKTRMCYFWACPAQQKF